MEATAANGAMHESSGDALESHRVTKARERRSSRRSGRVVVDAAAIDCSSGGKAADGAGDHIRRDTKSPAELGPSRQVGGSGNTSARHVTSDVTGTPPRHSTPIRGTPATVSAPNLSLSGRPIDVE